VVRRKFGVYQKLSVLLGFWLISKCNGTIAMAMANET
jgi:hypothetical protein